MSSYNELRSLTVVQLENILRDRKLKVSGRKSELIQRILDDIPFSIQKEFKQPFTFDYGLGPDGKPSDQLIEFIKSDKLMLIFRLHQIVERHPDVLESMLGYLDIFPNACLEHINFVGHKIDPYIYQNESILNFFTSELLDYVPPEQIDFDYPVYVPVDFYYSKAKNIEEYYDEKITEVKRRRNQLYGDNKDLLRIKHNRDALKRGIQYTYWRRNVEDLKHIRKCIDSGTKLMRIAIKLSPNRDDFPDSRAHVVQAILNLNTKRAQVIDTSAVSQVVDSVSIELFLKQIDPDITLNICDVTLCNRGSIQKGPLCATWSVYMFILYTLNSYSMSEMYNILIKYNDYKRSVLIFQYMYYIYNTGVLSYEDINDEVKKINNESSDIHQRLKNLVSL